MPGFHAIIHPSSCLEGFFPLFVDANATAGETKLSLWPPSSSSWSADTFTCSAYPPPPHLPRPLFLFQSFTKNFFSFYIFSPPHICTSITWPGESCGLHSDCCLGEEKRSVRQSSFLRGQSSTPHWTDPPLIYPSLLLRPRCCLKFWYDNCTAAVCKWKKRALRKSVLCRGKWGKCQISLTSMGPPISWLSSTRTVCECVCVCLPWWRSFRFYTDFNHHNQHNSVAGFILTNVALRKKPLISVWFHQSRVTWNWTGETVRRNLLIFVPFV